MRKMTVLMCEFHELSSQAQGSKLSGKHRTAVIAVTGDCLGKGGTTWHSHKLFNLQAVLTGPPAAEQAMPPW